MSRVRLVIFDLDGTLVDSHPFTYAAFRHALAHDATRPPADHEIHAAFGPPERVILARFVAPARIDAVYQRLQAYYAEHVRDLRVHVQMRPLLDDCVAAGLRLGVFTGRARDSTALILRSLGLATFFGAVIAGDDVEQPKPAPDGVVALMRALDVPAAATLVVGDSPLDLQAAHAAGADACFAAWFDRGGAPPDSLDCPDRLRPLVGLSMPC